MEDTSLFMMDTLRSLTVLIVPYIIRVLVYGVLIV